MHRTSLLAATLLLVSACDDAAKKDAAADKTAKADADKGDNEADETPAGDAADKADKAGEGDAEAAEPAVDERWRKKLDSRKLAASGLDVGSKLSAFDIINCETGDTYCQVCKFGGSPKIMAVGTPDDEAFKKDVKALDELVAKYGEDKVKAFAVVTELQGGKAVTPKDPDALKTAADALRKELGVKIPIVVPAPEDDGKNRVWDEYYNITASRTVMFADGSNEVKFHAVAAEDLPTALDAAVKSVVES